MFDSILEAIPVAFTLVNLAGAALGILAGTVLGAIPGLSGTMAIALLIPLTFVWPPLFSIALLIGCWKGSVYGGSISGILMNTPGTPEAAATAIDGYPLTLQGKGAKAIKMALYASVVGALISDLLLFGAAPPISAFALRFGPAELAMLILFALILVAGTGTGSHLKGLISTALGVLLAMVGLDPMTAQRRMTFGVLDLDRGLDLLAMLIGLLVLSEVLLQTHKGFSASRVSADAARAKRPEDARVSWTEFRRCLPAIFRSSILGSFCGALPGVGSITAAFMGYDQARLSSGHPETFGKGELKGVAAPEAANNAVCGTALIPLVTLGIPGSLSVAVIMGAFMIHGIAPGPRLMIEQPVLVYSLFLLLLISDVFMLFIALPLLKVANWVIDVPRNYLFPIILIFCAVGAYATNQSLFDVQVMVLFGIVGYLMKCVGLSPTALLIAYILAPMAETYMRQALRISAGDPSIFIGSWLSALFALAALAMLVWSLWTKGPFSVPKDLRSRLRRGADAE